jgi:hypothetical protein
VSRYAVAVVRWMAGWEVTRRTASVIINLSSLGAGGITSTGAMSRNETGRNERHAYQTLRKYFDDATTHGVDIQWVILPAYHKAYQIYPATRENDVRSGGGVSGACQLLRLGISGLRGQH